MSEQLRAFGRKVTDRLNSENDQVRRRWKAIVGVTFMFVFVVASVAVNQTVLALNKAAGNYGYVSGTYGYNATATSSDSVPSAATSFSCSAGTATGTVTCSWTAPTTTAGSTSYDNHLDYQIFYSSSDTTPTRSEGGSSWTKSNDSGLGTRTTSSTSVTGLTGGTAYYFTHYTEDGNTNFSAATSTVSATATASAGGSSGGGGSGTSVFSGTTTTTTTTTGTTTVPAVTSPTLVGISAPTTAAETAAAIGVAAPTAAILAQATTLLANVVPAAVLSSATLAVQEALKAFIAVGPSGVTASSAVVKIGAGERASLIEAFRHSQNGALPTTARDYQFLAAHIVDPTALAAGQAVADVTKLFPDKRNLTIEQDGLKDFTNCNKRPPSVDRQGAKLEKPQQDKEWAFVKYVGYQLKVDPAHRSLGTESSTIKKFKSASLAIYKNGKKVVKPAGIVPKDLYDWNFVRAASYAGAPTSCLK